MKAKKIAIVYLDNGEKLKLTLGDILDDTDTLIQQRIIDRKIFKVYDQYINMLHITKIEVKDEIINLES